MPSKTEKRRITKLAAQARAEGLPPPMRSAKSRNKAAAKPSTATATQSADAGKIVLPTPERLAKEDKPIKRDTGGYLAPAPISRLHSRRSLDHNDYMNDMMYDEALELQRNHYQSGLNGLSAQDLNRVMGGGSDAAYMMPRNHSASHHRQELIKKLNAMGWFPMQPNRGCGRVVFSVVCLETPFSEAGQLYCGVSHPERAASVAMDRLRSGLMTLVDLKKIRSNRAWDTGVLGAY